MWRSLRLRMLPALGGASAVVLQGNFLHCKEASDATSRGEAGSPLHHASPYLQMRGRALSPKRAKSYRRSGATDVVRIALTGGPCAGKSSALDEIIEVSKKAGFDVYCAPETATIIFNSGVAGDDLQAAEFRYSFQVALARMQLAMEKSLTKIAESTGRPSIVIFDRGLLDGKAYVDADEWQKILAKLGNDITEEYMFSRYDCVLHLVTAADGAEKFYKFGKTTDDSGRAVTRLEPPEKAILLDKSLQDVWAGHPNHVILRNEGSFKDKLARVSAEVLRVANSKH